MEERDQNQVQARLSSGQIKPKKIEMRRQYAARTAQSAPSMAHHLHA
jgi:hypothetical protein